MNKIRRISLTALTSGMFLILLPQLVFAGDSGWHGLAWQKNSSEYRAENGMWKLHRWLDDIHSDFAKRNWCDTCGGKKWHSEDWHNRKTNSNSSSATVNIRQSQEVSGKYESAWLEQNARVYVDGVLVDSSSQKTHVENRKDGNVKQIQNISVSGKNW